MSSKIEQIIEEMEDFVEDCKYQTFSNSNIVIEKEKLVEYLRELKTKTPEEIKRYQKIISNKEAILNDAREKADALIAEAQVHTDQMINEHEIMKQAYDQANAIVQQAVDQAQHILDSATEDANGIRQSAMTYTDGMLAELQNIVKNAVGSVEEHYGSLITDLKNCSTIIDKNRADLYPQVNLDNEIASIEGESVSQQSANNQGGLNNSKDGKNGALNLDILNK